MKKKKEEIAGEEKKKVAVKKEETAVKKVEKVSESKSLAALKQYLKDKAECKVTFIFPKEAAQGAKSVKVIGDFNNWDKRGILMKAAKNGFYTATVTLPTNHEYRYKYLIDDSKWENDWCADKYVKNSYGSEDSVVVV